jgi:NAD(P)-dependent dehydrogenase (short-subunit alcohol dehydrogenase family)
MAVSLADKVAIVTGAGSGIGAAVSLELAKRGARVIVADIDGDHATKVAATITDNGGRATASQVDVTKEPAVRGLVADTVAGYGRLDYQFNNAGIAISGDARDLTIDQWRRVLDVDLNGVMHGTLAAYPVMVKQGFGHIVNTASAAGLVPTPLNAPYCTAKYAVVGMSLSLRMEGADLGVKVSVVCPGYVRTPIFDTAVMVGLSRDVVSRPPGRIKWVEPGQAARIILGGVVRNRAVIAFPGYIRLAWRVACLFPQALTRTAAPQLRDLRARRSTAVVDPEKQG